MELAFGSKEQQRENLAKLVGKGIIKFSARITAGRKVGATPMRILKQRLLKFITYGLKIILGLENLKGSLQNLQEK